MESKVSVDDKAEKWIKHYSSSHKILLVGEGDFSFSACLAEAFGSASNMVATSLDSKAFVANGVYTAVGKDAGIFLNAGKCNPEFVSAKNQKTSGEKHPTAVTNLKKLEEYGCNIVHGVDACTMSQHPLLNLKTFDRIVFNFPHAGFLYSEHSKLQIQLHQDVVRGFLRNARDMITKGGEVHVTHKTAHPFSMWEIEKLAGEAGLHLVEEVIFTTWDYPGYENKRGDGYRSNDTFPVGQCSTFKFSKL